MSNGNHYILVWFWIVFKRVFLDRPNKTLKYRANKEKIYNMPSSLLCLGKHLIQHLDNIFIKSIPHLKSNKKRRMKLIS